ncbi:MAG: hypothetical protein HY566_02405 [Candidatus Kerfeldbacteria bacterium]|nr:hypothetical protein [Candidatus Kerfeldbacteria bacterium]
MIWANFLHVYQPAEQQEEILEAIISQSYRPVFLGLKQHRRAKMTLNINGALLELFDKYNHADLIDILRAVGRERRLEFTGSAKYHALLPFLDKDEVVRQITINNETIGFYLGDAYQPRGFFPPEMAFKEELAPILEELGFEWVILDEIASGEDIGTLDYTKRYQIKGTKLGAYFRERRPSNLIMSAVARTSETLRRGLHKELLEDRYMITAMDGETFGHHRPGLENLLFDIFDAQEFHLVTISEVKDHFHSVVEVLPVQSTWASSKEDILKKVQFLSWSDPKNDIHSWQWELLHLVLGEVKKMDASYPQYAVIRKKMDIALASDHFWWASAKPWWSLEMIEDGAYRLLDTLRSMPDIGKENLERARDLYEKIVSTAFHWQRTGKIRKMMKEQQSILRIPFKERTVGHGGEEEGVYHAFIEMMGRLEKKAREKGEYEKAILWRDAIFKLEHKLDIYDAINAVDLVRVEIPHEEVEATIQRYRTQYRTIRGGQPEQRGQ